MSVIPNTVERLGLHTIIHATLAAHAITFLLNGDPAIAVNVPLDLHTADVQLHLLDSEGRRRNA